MIERHQSYLREAFLELIVIVLFCGTLEASMFIITFRKLTLADWERWK